MPLRLLALLLAVALPALADEEDEPMPSEPPPVIYVPLAAPSLHLPPAKPRTKGEVLVRLDVAGVYRYVLKESFGAVAAHLLLGGEHGALSFAGTLDVELGASRERLFHSVIAWGFLLSGRVGERLRLGLGPHLGMMIISRATDNNPASDMIGFLVGVAGDFTIDLVHKKQAALLLSGRLGYDFVDTGHLYSYSNGMFAQLGLGVRL